MKFLLLFLASTGFVSGQTYYNYLNYCSQGGQKVVTNGSSANNFWQQSYPNCLVTVYQTGTTNLATLYKDSAGVYPLNNPFAAASTGQFTFYTAAGYYDLSFSGSTIPSPFSWVNIGVGTSGGGGGGSSAGPTGSIQTAAPGGAFSYIANPLPIVNGGNGTATPSLLGGTGITISGSWPGQTVALTGAPTIYAGTPASEVPSGAINGVNTVFTLANSPNTGTLILTKNGQVMQGGAVDYTLSTNTITFQAASIPVTSDTLFAYYQYGSSTVPGGNATTINGASVPANAVIATNGASQLVDGTAFVKNVSNRIVARDAQNALDNGNFSTNGIAGAVTACGSSNPCNVLVPPAYPTTEGTPCQSFSTFYFSPPAVPCATTSNVQILDQRYGDYRSYQNSIGLGTTGTTTNGPILWNFNYNLPNFFKSHQEGGVQGLTMMQNAMVGGANINAVGWTDKTNWNAFTAVQNIKTSGQAIAAQIAANHTGMGDTLAASFSSNCGGGENTGSDEGCQWADIHVGQFLNNNQQTGDYVGTITGVSGTVITTTISNAMASSQGEWRTVIDTNPTYTLSTGTVTLASPQGASYPEIVNFAGTTFSQPTVAATLGTGTGAVVPCPTSPTSGCSAGSPASVVPQTVTVTPANYAFSTSISGITVGSKVCVMDVGGYEVVSPIAVSGSTFTATFQRPHAANAQIQVGGVCGLGLNISADNVTSGNQSQNFLAPPVVGTIRTIWPVMNAFCQTSASLTTCNNNQLTIYNQADGIWDPIVTQTQNLTGLNGYTLYPASYATQVQDNGGTGDTFTLMPFPVAGTFATSDTIEQTMGPLVRVGLGVWELHGNQATGQYTTSGSGINYSQPMQGSDVMWALTNGAPEYYYNSYNAQTGIGSLVPTTGHLGTGYAVGDLIEVTPGGCTPSGVYCVPAVGQVATINVNPPCSGAPVGCVSSISMTCSKCVAGSAYSIGNSAATTALTGSGTGLLVTIPTLTTASHGVYVGPQAIQVSGKHQYGLSFSEPGDYATVTVGCPPSPQICNKVDSFLYEGNIFGSSDIFSYNESTAQWQILAGNGNGAASTITNYNGSGSGYTVGATFTITGAAGTPSGGGTFAYTCTSTPSGIVQAVSGGVPTLVSINGQGQHGAGCTPTSGTAYYTTTLSTGSGSGLQLTMAVQETQHQFWPDRLSSPVFLPPPTPLVSTTGCTAEYGGAITSISDSQTLEPGAIITGGGIYKVDASCLNGQWVVMGGLKPSQSNSFGIAPGPIHTATVHGGDGGSGYVTGNTFTINGGSVLATGTVTASGGVVSSVTLTSYGQGYAPGMGVATTATSGVGTGLILDTVLSYTGAIGSSGSPVTICPLTQCGPGPGNYTVSIPFSIMSTGSVGSVSVYLVFSDGSGSKNYLLQTITDSGTPMAYLIPVYAFHSDGSVPIAMYTTYTSTGGTALTYGVAPTVIMQ